MAWSTSPSVQAHCQRGSEFHRAERDPSTCCLTFHRTGDRIQQAAPRSPIVGRTSQAGDSQKVPEDQQTCTSGRRGCRRGVMDGAAPVRPLHSATTPPRGWFRRGAHPLLRENLWHMHLVGLAPAHHHLPHERGIYYIVMDSNHPDGVRRGWPPTPSSSRALVTV